MKKLFLIFSTVFASILFNGCTSSEDAKTIIEDNSSFQELKAKSKKTFTLKTTKGGTISLKIENDILISEQLSGKVVLLNFWATWCPPCIEEMPVLNELYEKYNKDFEIVGILFEKEKDLEELKAFIRKYKMKFPVTLGAENFQMAKAFDNVRKIPESFLYAKDGKFIKKYIGKIGKTDLEKYLMI